MCNKNNLFVKCISTSLKERITCLFVYLKWKLNDSGSESVKFCIFYHRERKAWKFFSKHQHTFSKQKKCDIKNFVPKSLFKNIFRLWQNPFNSKFYKWQTQKTDKMTLFWCNHCKMLQFYKRMHIFFDACNRRMYSFPDNTGNMQ